MSPTPTQPPRAHLRRRQRRRRRPFIGALSVQRARTRTRLAARSLARSPLVTGARRALRRGPSERVAVPRRPISGGVELGAKFKFKLAASRRRGGRRCVGGGAPRGPRRPPPPAQWAPKLGRGGLIVTVAHTSTHTQWVSPRKHSFVGRSIRSADQLDLDRLWRASAGSNR